MNILITGITGFVGQELTSHLKDDGNTYYLLVRPKSLDKAKKLMSHVKNFIFISGDLTEKFSFSENINESIDKIFHMAAYYDITADFKESQKHNVLGTQNVLEFASRCPNLKELHYISTIAVAGDFHGVYNENDFNRKQNFNNAYSETKYIAEDQVRQHKFSRHCHVKKVIYRPGIVVGHSQTGEFATVNGPYYFFSFLNKLSSTLPILKKLPLLLFPYNRQTQLPLIPVDHLSAFLYKNLITTQTQSESCYHVISSNTPTMTTFLKDIMSHWGFHGTMYPLRKTPLNKVLLKTFGLPEQMEQYLFAQVTYDNKNYQQQSNPTTSNYNDYKDVTINTGLSSPKTSHGHDDEYFQGLNYSLGNEDTTLEHLMCQKLGPEKILTIAGSGSRVLPLISPNTKKVTCVDLSVQQLYLCQLREQTIKHLSLADYLGFWGFHGAAHFNHQQRMEVLKKLELSHDARTYLCLLSERSQETPLLYMGKWEKTFIFFSKVAKKILGPKAYEIFEFDSLQEQKRFYQKSFPHLRWTFIILILGNKSLFNALLYKGHFIKKNVKESYFTYYKNAFEHLMTKQLAKESFFLNLCFFGKLASVAANTIETKESCFQIMKQALSNQCHMEYVEDNLFDAAKKSQHQYNFVSLSDVPSYFSGEDEVEFMQRLTPNLAPGAVVVVRYYLRVCPADTAGFEDITHQYNDLIRRETVQMYRIKVYEYKG